MIQLSDYGSAAEFWEELYRKSSPRTKGQPSAVLERFVKGRPAGTALELGCAKGDDAVWLAKVGWLAGCRGGYLRDSSFLCESQCKAAGRG